jgi:hypothetical protein
MTPRPPTALQPIEEESPPPKQTAALERLRVARDRAEPIVAELLRSIQQDPPLRLDATVIKARRELDLLWQAVGRITAP